jgi:hypothetical protein
MVDVRCWDIPALKEGEGVVRLVLIRPACDVLQGAV